MESNPYAAPHASLDVSVATDGPQRVGFWPRFGAALIDGVVVWVLGILVSGFVASLFPDYIADTLARSQAKVDPKVAAQIGAMLKFSQSIIRWGMGVTVVSVIYSLLEGLTGRALGKMLLGLRIAGLEGQPAPLGRLLARTGCKQLAGLITLVAMATSSHLLAQIAQVPSWAVIVGFLFVLAKHKRALHDLAAGTAVYHNTDLVGAAR
jgi:uncharacterized RDD family membrane protein YckC